MNGQNGPDIVRERLWSIDVWNEITALPDDALDRALIENGINPVRMVRESRPKIDAMLARADLDAARAELDAVRSSLPLAAPGLDLKAVRDRLVALLQPMGASQPKVAAYFRRLSDADEEDLRSVLADAELLEWLHNSGSQDGERA